jgi:hypothetical protein
MGRSINRRQALAGGAGLLFGKFLLATGRSLARPGAGGLIALPVPLRPLHGHGRGWAAWAQIKAPVAFDLIGARWHSGHPTEVQVRAERRGRWSHWLTLPASGGHVDGQRPNMNHVRRRTGNRSDHIALATRRITD